MALEKTYKAKNVVAAIGEVSLEGFGPDSFVTVAFAEDFTSVQIGADGKTNTRTRKANRSATITFTFMQHAPVNDYLSILLAADELTGLGVRPFGMRDLTTGATFVAADCWISKPPDAEYAAESGTFEWQLQTDKLVATYGDPATRLV